MGTGQPGYQKFSEEIILILEAVMVMAMGTFIKRNGQVMENNSAKDPYISNDVRTISPGQMINHF